MAVLVAVGLLVWKHLYVDGLQVFSLQLLHVKHTQVTGVVTSYCLNADVCD